MSGRPDSDTDPETARTEAAEERDKAEDRAADEQDKAEDRAADEQDKAEDPAADEQDEVEDRAADAEEARRARWTAAGTGAALTLAGLAAALLRLTRSAPALVPAAYAGGAAVCAAATVLGSRGRTRRALWLLVAGVMVMALGDQFD
ncbi:hypothetical protein [Streptomyces luteogriseus]|uniref:hypothetical protein n=2 Tax=Streptomyces luteogriseus TaxID=68233 RepID=UPI002E32CF66|nr:hypothetical protein [Streptomyces luteogriseus]WTJ27726.1 hypothetical protein OID52_11945 [Streptomyces luteogriseus]